jgi:hypothetical protein
VQIIANKKEAKEKHSREAQKEQRQKDKKADVALPKSKLKDHDWQQDWNVENLPAMIKYRRKGEANGKLPTLAGNKSLSSRKNTLQWGTKSFP